MDPKDKLIEALLLAIDAYTRELNSVPGDRDDGHAPTSHADQINEAGTDLQTQVKSQGDADRKLIAHLVSENNSLRGERDRLKAELERKSAEWKQIKEKLRQRQTLRNVLGPTLEDENDLTSSPAKPMHPAPSEEDQTRIQHLPSQDGIAILAEAANSPLEKENTSNSVDMVVGMKRKVAEGHRNDCPCCVKYFQAVGQDPSDTTIHQAISRHNYRQIGPGTPPGFWNVGFTQE